MSAHSMLPATLLVLATVSLSCDSTGPLTESPMGSLQIAVTTAGADIDLDHDGYSLKVDNEADRSLPFAPGLMSLQLSPGSHRVRLEGVAPNCSIASSNERLVNIIAAGAAAITFDVSCMPNTGTLRIVTSTSGPNASSYNFSADLPVIGAIALGANGTAEFTNVRVGDFTVTLKDISTACAMASLNPQPAHIGFNTITEVSFSIRCSPYEDGELLAYVHNADIYVSHPDGTGARQLTTQGEDLGPAWSPDGKKIAFATDRDGNFEIYVMNADGTNPVRLTDDPAANGAPAWSPDGARIAFQSQASNLSHEFIDIMNSDGTNRTRLTDGDAPDWSPDGKRVAFHNGTGIWTIDLDGSNARQVTHSPNGTFGDIGPKWSPDGSQIAFMESDWYSSYIGLVNSDGSALRWLDIPFNYIGDPTWVDNNSIAFIASATCWTFNFDCNPQILKSSRLGGDAVEVSTLRPARQPAWRR